MDENIKFKHRAIVEKYDIPYVENYSKSTLNVDSISNIRNTTLKETSTTDIARLLKDPISNQEKLKEVYE